MFGALSCENDRREGGGEMCRGDGEGGDGWWVVLVVVVVVVVLFVSQPAASENSSTDDLELALSAGR